MALNTLFKTTFSRLLLPTFNKSTRLLTNGVPALNKKEVEITFKKHDGTKIKAKGKVGETMLDVVVNYNLDLDGFGACEGTLTCSTCHVVFTEEDYNKLPDKPGGEECDMLELAHELTPTSRLGCQIVLSDDLDGVEVKIPESKNDLRLT